MARIITTTESQGLERIPQLGNKPSTRPGAVTYAAAAVADLLDVKYLVAFTASGDSARRMSRLRCRIPLLVFTPDPAVRSQLALTWGVETFLTAAVGHTDDLVAQVDELLLETGHCQVGDQVVMVFGSPPGVRGSLNALRVHQMGEAGRGSLPNYLLD
jgi:pyruvate kinase